MRTLIFQHTPDEGPGTLTEWLATVRLPFHIHHSYLNQPMPEPAAYDWLIVLGGPMNVDEENKHPWLKVEKDFIRAWIAENKAILGICLGGQLMAQVLGAKVGLNQVREIGFHSVTRTGNDHPSLRRWPMTTPVFQWHQDFFTLPEGCKPLLSSEACAHQAFALNRKTIGIQFHPEAAEDWISLCYRNLEKRENEPFVQDSDQCRTILPAHLPVMTKNFFHLLEDFVENAR